MPDIIPVKMRPLSGEAFRPYGQVLERGGLIYPDTDDGRVAMELLQVRFPVVMEKFLALRGERRAVSPRPPSRLSLPASCAFCSLPG
jgi:hypothetical protein